MRKTSWPAWRERKLIRLFKSGLTFQKIADELNANRSIVAGKLYRLNMTHKNRSSWSVDLGSRSYNKMGDWDKRGNFKFCQWLEEDKFCHEPIKLNKKFAFCDNHLGLVLRCSKRL